MSLDGHLANTCVCPHAIREQLEDVITLLGRRAGALRLATGRGAKGLFGRFGLVKHVGHEPREVGTVHSGCVDMTLSPSCGFRLHSCLGLGHRQRRRQPQQQLRLQVQLLQLRLRAAVAACKPLLLQ